MRKIGPHEGHEIDMLLRGEKKLAIFYHVDDEKIQVDESEVQKYIDEGKLFKEERYYCHIDSPRVTRYIFYYLPGERWRFLTAEYLTRQLRSQSLVYGPWYDEVMGGLLGYPEEAVQAFIERKIKQQRKSTRDRPRQSSHVAP